MSDAAKVILYAIDPATHLAVPVLCDAAGNLQIDVVTSPLESAVYADDADWTNDASKHALVGGLYQVTRHAVTDGDVGPLAIDANGRLVVIVDGSLRVALTKVTDAESVAAAASCLVTGLLLTYCREGIVVISCNKSHTVEYMHSAAVEDNWTHGYYSKWQKVTGADLTEGAGRVMPPVDLEGHATLGVKVTNNDAVNAATVSVWIGGRA